MLGTALLISIASAAALFILMVKLNIRQLPDNVHVWTYA